MSEPALLALIRGDHTRVYGNRWAAVFLHRELMWGPDDFEAWVGQQPELELEDWETGDAGAVADYDRKKLVWCGSPEALRIPRLSALYGRLLQAAWPGFEVVRSTVGCSDLSQCLGLAATGEPYKPHRPESIAEAARTADEVAAIADEEEAEDSGDRSADEPFGEDEIRAWVTILGADGTIRHRHLERLSADLLRGDADALSALAQLRPAAVPPEAVVAEGLWIDETKKTLGVWGDRALEQIELPEIREQWSGWSVTWADGGYAEQCRACGLMGIPLSDAEALAKILPMILSTKQFDVSTVMGALGAGLKRTAMKATGCLLFVICLPLVVFGLVSGNWKAVGISIGITCLVVIALFKMVEYRFKRSFRNKVSGAEADGKSPPAAGPLDASLRRQRLDALLARSHLPKLSEVEPLFPRESELDLLS